MKIKHKIEQVSVLLSSIFKAGKQLLFTWKKLMQHNLSTSNFLPFGIVKRRERCRKIRKNIYSYLGLFLFLSNNILLCVSRTYIIWFFTAFYTSKSPLCNPFTQISQVDSSLCFPLLFLHSICDLYVLNSPSSPYVTQKFQFLIMYPLHSLFQ